MTAVIFLPCSTYTFLPRQITHPLPTIDDGTNDKAVIGARSNSDLLALDTRMRSRLGCEILAYETHIAQETTWG